MTEKEKEIERGRGGGGRNVRYAEKSDEGKSPRLGDETA